jgi:hypothetical protein
VLIKPWGASTCSPRCDHVVSRGVAVALPCRVRRYCTYRLTYLCSHSLPSAFGPKPQRLNLEEINTTYEPHYGRNTANVTWHRIFSRRGNTAKALVETSCTNPAPIPSFYKTDRNLSGLLVLIQHHLGTPHVKINSRFQETAATLASLDGKAVKLQEFEVEGCLSRSTLYFPDSTR